MTRYLIHRLLALVPIWLIITFLAFLVAALAPGDPALTVLRQRSDQPPTPQELAELRQELHLDEPLPAQYLRWVSNAATGDLGTSFKGAPVLPELVRRLRASLQLAVPAFLLSLAIALPLGAVSALKRGSPTDHLSRTGTLVVASVPSFWLGYLLIILFSVQLQLLPVAGRGSWKHVVMPALTLALGGGASMGRLVRSSLLDAMSEDYIRTARAKGLSERMVVATHAMRNSLLPVLTVSGLRFGRLLAGAAIVETVFTWPGVGRYMVEAINDRDYPAVQGVVLFAGTIFVLMNLIADLAAARIDPRIRQVSG